LDTRSKIVSAKAVPPGCTVVVGAFDPLLSGDARELWQIRAAAPLRPLIAIILPLAGELFTLCARSELVAAMRVVDYVITADDTPVDALLDAIRPALVVRLEAAQAERKRQLIEHVHGRQSS
jgi:hypothetical protein